jgi:hypothetical protein
MVGALWLGAGAGVGAVCAPNCGPMKMTSEVTTLTVLKYCLIVFSSLGQQAPGVPVSFAPSVQAFVALGAIN